MLSACNELKDNIINSITNDITERNTPEMQRYALIIGNSNYIADPSISPLRNPVNDAHDMKQTLEQLDFKVIYRENVANRKAMETAVNEFAQQLRQNRGVGLFYYAGHGIQANGKNYLIPTKVRIPTQVQLKKKAMAANYVLKRMELAKNALNIIILDACRDNPLPVNKTRGGKKPLVKNGLAKMDNPAGSILIYSTAPGKQAYDGYGRNGVFTKHLLNGIKEHGHLSIQDMLILVRQNVKQETEDEPVQQVPWENTSLDSKFCFSLSGCNKPSKNNYENDGVIMIPSN